MKYYVLPFIVFGLLLCSNTAVHAQGKKLPVPKLTSSILKKMGYAGIDFTKQDDSSWTLKNGIVIYSTYPYATKVKGFVGPTPLFIAVDNEQKIKNVTMAKNNETPEYIPIVKPLLKAWDGKTLKEARTYKPDVITGATITSNAIIKNVQAAANALGK